MGLTEKTLEVNVTHELLALGDGLGRLMGEALKQQGRGEIEAEIRRRFGGLLGPPYALGLTLRDEQRQGWDVQLALPPGPWMPARAFFMQFKIGSPRTYSRDPDSAFLGSRVNPKPHVLFGVNNNGARDQHVALQRLADEVAFQDSVLYAFPLVPDADAFHQLLGQLAVHTTWVTIRRLDTLATPPIVAGDERHLVLDYGGVPRELRSEPVRLDDHADIDVSADVIGEFLRLRAAKTVFIWSSAMNEMAPDSLTQFNWGDVIDRHILSIGQHFGSVEGLPERLRENAPELSQVRGRGDELDRALRTITGPGSELTIQSSKSRRTRVVSRAALELSDIAGVMAGQRVVDPSDLIPTSRYSVQIGENYFLRIPGSDAQSTTPPSLARSFLSSSCQII